ncbi:MAG: phosphatase PAP2 family protein [Synergistaceae bacterium]|nr:phosphatase PAP2 family protein [Synergistaceae bacterium]
MDIEILLQLQDFRISTGDILTPFVNWLSHAAITWLLFVPFVIYWCISKREGLFMIISLGISRFLNGIMKVTACAYRPFVRDSRIIPAGHKPSGYSFPSGHTMWASPILGGLIVITRRKSKIFAWLCGILIIIVALSRMYLGAHTPQDVICGTLAGLLSLWIGAYIMKRPERENSFLVAGLVLCVLGVIYTAFKPYPMDYVDGKLLVDPDKMMLDTFYAVGMMTGLILGRWIEREYIRFNVTGLNVRGVILAVIGLVPVYFIACTFAGDYKFLFDFLSSMFGDKGGRFAMGFIFLLWTVAIWPCVIKFTEGKK